MRIVILDRGRSKQIIYNIILSYVILCVYRLLRAATATSTIFGGSVFLAYQVIHDFIQHHNTYPDRPKYLDHITAITIISVVTGLFKGGLPRYGFVGAFLSIFFISPLSWWLFHNGIFRPHVKAPNIFYEEGTTLEEVDRIRHLDAIETTAY